MAYIALLASAGLSAYSSYAQGQQQKRQSEYMMQEKEFEAAQAEQAANAEMGAAQIRAAQEKRKSRIIQSRAMALAASSGGGASDPTVVNIISDLESEGSYRAAVAMYEGQDRARTLRLQAAGGIYEGQAGLNAGRSAAEGGNYRAAGSLFSAGANLYGKYGYPRGRGNTDWASQPTGAAAGVDLGTYL